MTTTQNSTAVKAELAQRTAEGTVDLDLLGLAVQTSHYEGYETIPYSLGMAWIGENTEKFLELLQSEGVTLEDFFRPRLDPFYVVSGLLNNTQLLLAVADDRRMSFVREVFLAAGDVYDHWLETALRVGISKDDLAEMILEKLRCTEVELGSGVANFTKNAFMENGSGRVVRYYSGGPGFFEEADTYWGVLSDDQLVEAMKIVAQTAPNLLFCGRGFNESFSTSGKLRLRLGDDKTNALLEFAAGNLQHLTLVSLETLAELPIDVQLKQAQRLKLPFGQWIIQMAIEIGGRLGGQLIKESEDGDLANINSFFIWWRNLKHQKNDPLGLRAEIESRLREGLKKAGWMVGILKSGTHKGRSQYFVCINGRKYVMDYGQHDYGTFGGRTRQWPHDDDVVLFRPESAFQLVPGKVFAVTFTLVTSGKKK